MTIQTTDPYRRKKIKGVFVIMLTTASILAYNAFLIYYDRAVFTSEETETQLSIDTNINEDMFTSVQVAEHNKSDDCWVSAFGSVYNLTSYVTSGEHPGGQSSLISSCGEEISDSFNRIHSAEAREYLQTYLIGTLEVE